MTSWYINTARKGQGEWNPKRRETKKRRRYLLVAPCLGRLRSRNQMRRGPGALLKARLEGRDMT